MTTFIIPDKSAVTSIDPTADVFPVWQGAAQKKATATDIVAAAGALLVSTSKTIVVAAAGGDFTSVQAALASLDNIVLGASAFITIQVNDGTYANITPILMEGPYGRNITIRGQHTYPINVTSVQSSSGSAGAWSIVLNTNSVAHVAVNDYIALTAPANGTLPSYLAGVHKITNVDAINTRITIASKHVAATAPSGAVTATGTVLKSILTFSGCDGVEIWEGGTSLNLRDIMLVGDGTHYGISVQDVGRCLIGDPGAAGSGGTVGVSDFSVNVWWLYNSEINGDTLVSSHATYQGFLLDIGSCCSLWTTITSGNGSNGIEAENGSAIWSLNPMISTGNASQGFKAGKTGSIDATNAIATGNGAYGVYSEFNGYVLPTGVSASNNTTGDYYPPQYPASGSPYTFSGGFSGNDGYMGVFGATRANILIGSKYTGGGMDTGHLRFVTGNLSVSDASAASIAHIYSQQTSGDATSGGELYIQTKIPSGALVDRLVFTDTDTSFRKAGGTHTFTIVPWSSGANVYDNSGSSPTVYFGRNATANNIFSFTNNDASATIFSVDTSARTAKASIGNATSTAPVAVTPSVQVSRSGVAAGNTGGDYVLATYTIPANAFGAAGRTCKITGYGKFASNGNTKQLRVYVGCTSAVVGSLVSGGTVIADTGAVTASGTGWRVAGRVIKDGSANSNTQVSMQDTGTTAVAIPQALTITENAGIIVCVTGNATTTATDILMHGFLVEFTG